MTELIYRGNKYTPAKNPSSSQSIHLKYCGHEIMSKRIHAAMKAEMS